MKQHLDLVKQPSTSHQPAINQPSTSHQRVPWDMELPIPAERVNAMEGSESLRNYMEALGTHGPGDCTCKMVVNCKSHYDIEVLTIIK